MVTKEKRKQYNQKYYTTAHGVIHTIYRMYRNRLIDKGEKNIPTPEEFKTWIDATKFHGHYRRYKNDNYDPNSKPKMVQLRPEDLSLDNFIILPTRNAPRNSKPVILDNGGTSTIYISAEDAAMKLGVTVKTIKDGCNGKTKTRMGKLRYLTIEERITFLKALDSNYSAT